MTELDDAVARILEGLRLPNTNGAEQTELPVTGWQDALIDWPAFWARDRSAGDWLWEPLWPRGKAIVPYAKRGTGKSELVLYGAASLATGTKCLRTPTGEPVDVVLLDLEMNEDDLDDRLSEMGWGGANLEHLHYYLLPRIPPLDTMQGGGVVREIVDHHQAAAVVIDSTGRVVSGEENSNDTFSALYEHTISPLKRAGVTSVWIGHAGKDLTRGQRGGSAGEDVVDLIWQQTRQDGGGVRLKSTKQRSNWIPQVVDLQRLVDGTGQVSYQLVADTWPAGTKEATDELDRLNAPLEMSRRDAAKLLRDHEIKHRNDVIGAALRWRRERPR